MSAVPMTWVEDDEEQFWESDKFTVMDELMYQAGVDQAPEKEKTGDQIHTEHLENLEMAKSTEARMERMEAVSKFMTEDELREGRMPGVSSRVLKHGEAGSAATGAPKKGFIAPVQSDDSDSDIFSDDDEEVSRSLQQLRQLRIAQLQQQRRAGDPSQLLPEVLPESFENDVKLASRHGLVLMLLYRERDSASALMLGHLEALARKYPTLRVCRMRASEQVQNFPLGDCPTLMAYKEGRVAAQMVRLDAFGGSRCTAKDVEWRLAQKGLIESDLNEDPRESALFEE